ALTSPEARSNFSNLVDASLKQAVYTSNLASRASAEEDAYDEMIERAQRLTGVQLENPMRAGYAEELDRQLRAKGDTGFFGQGYRTSGSGMLKQREAIFQEKLAQLRRDNRDVATDLTFDLATERKGLVQRVNLKAEKAAAKPLAPALKITAEL